MVPFLRLLGASAGRAVLERAWPTYSMIGVVAALVFGRNGMDPSTLTSWAIESVAGRVWLFGVWWVLTLGAVRPIFATPSTIAFRALPIARYRVSGACLALLLALQIPWMVLWWSGAGLLWMMAATAGAVAGSVFMVGRLRSIPELLTAAAFLVSLVIGQPLLLAVVGCAAAWLMIPRLWAAMAEPGSTGQAVLVFGPAPVALALACGLSLWRGQRATCLRAGLFWAAGVGLARLALHNNRATIDVAQPSVFVATVVAAFAATMVLAGPANRVAEQGRTEVLLAGRAPGLLRVAASVVLAAAGILSAGSMLAVLALTHGPLAPSSATIWSLMGLALWSGVAGSAIGVLAGVVAPQRDGEIEAGGRRLLLGVLGVVLGSLALVQVTTVAVTAGVALCAALATLVRLPARGPEREAKGDDMLEFDGVHKWLSGRHVVDGLSIAVGPGEVLTVTGSNGAGKSTILRLAAGLWLPERGHVRVCGHSTSTDGQAARRQVGYVSDAMDKFVDITVAEYLALIRSLRRPCADESLQGESLGTAAFLHQRFGTLSLGQRKRAVLRAATIGAPALLVLDEPSNGLDPEGVRAVVQLIAGWRERGASAIVATNDMEFASALEGTRLALAAG